jgi:hypothetical protein
MVDEYTLRGTFMAASCPDEVYLFLYTADIDYSNGHLTVHLPPAKERYYWSFDPEGEDALPLESLDELLLPHVDFTAQIWCDRWTQEVYSSIADCQRAKGFDPSTQDVAIELGYPLVDMVRLNNLINVGRVSLSILTIYPYET